MKLKDFSFPLQTLALSQLNHVVFCEQTSRRKYSLSSDFQITLYEYVSNIAAIENEFGFQEIFSLTWHTYTYILQKRWPALHTKYSKNIYEVYKNHSIRNGRMPLFARFTFTVPLFPAGNSTPQIIESDLPDLSSINQGQVKLGRVEDKARPQSVSLGSTLQNT